MNRIYLDFETRSQVDIKVRGAGPYCMDTSTEILCLAYAKNDESIRRWSAPGMPPIFDTWANDPDYVFIAHNAFFERMIWKHVWKKEPPRFFCTMSKGCSHGLPWKLEKLALSLKLKELKDMEGMRLIRLFSIPKNDGTFNDPDEFPEEFEKFIQYCMQDVRVEREIDKMLPDLCPQEQQIFDLTMTMNQRGIFIDQDLASDAVLISENIKEKCNDKIGKLTNGKILAVTQTVRLKNYVNNRFFLDMPSVSADDIEDQLSKPNETPPELEEILRLRLEYGRSSIAKFNRALDTRCSDGRVRNHLMYHGATTGRWASLAVQFQNLFRGTGIDQEICISIIKQKSADLFDFMYSDPMSALSSCVRGIIIASPGKKLLVADYASIEARVLMWVAGQRDAIRLFKERRDIYIEMAKVIYNDPLLTKQDKDKRQLGKQAVLGCGYQMGADKFMGTCKSYGIMIDRELAVQAVNSYRNTYRRVVSFWKDIEEAALYAVTHKKPCHCGPITFFIKGRFLYCRLPSGRNLAYYYPIIADHELPWGETKKSLFYFTNQSETGDFKKTYTYGGKLTENIVQATARDIMANAMLILEERGFPVILSIHDEIICEVDEPSQLDDMITIMCDLPKWAEGCPIDAEGWEGYRYKK